MFGFPVNLNSNDIQKFTNDPDNGFQKLEKREIFYTMRNGDYDTMQWQTASGRVGLLPGINDDVIIRHNVVIINAISRVRNFIVSGTGYVTFTGALNVSITCLNYRNFGVVDWSLTPNQHRLFIYGNDNYFGNTIFNLVQNTLINYVGSVEQIIEPITYGAMILSGGRKIFKGDLIVKGSFESSCHVDLSGYNVTIFGNTSVNGGLFSATESSNMLFIGNVVFNGNNRPTIAFDGAVNCEFRNSVGFHYWSIQSYLQSGTGTWRFTTNNQSIYAALGGNSNLVMNARISIADNITLTIESTTLLNTYNTINGETSTSKLINKGTINFMNLESVASMTTGITDFSTFTNTIGYTGNYTATIPSYFPTFHNLVISGTGTKSLAVNTTMNGYLDLQGNNVVGQAGILQCGNFNLSVFGQTYVGSDRGKSATLAKSGPGNVLFGGLLSTSNNGDYITFNGNPNVEMRGGMDVLSPPSFYNSGTGTWTFSTNNQGISSYAFTFSGNVFINGAITITNNMQVAIIGTLDGNNANSKWVLNAVLDLYNSTPPFATLGILDYTTNTNASIGFRYNGNGTLPVTTFQGLRIGGTGTKTLSGNTLVQRVLDLIGNSSGTPGTEGILECSTFNLQIDGITNAGSDLGKGATLSKNGAGNIIFGGYLSTTNGGDRILLTGNPTIEFKNGIYPLNAGVGTIYNFGTGLITFSTNNQTLTMYYNQTFQNNMLISGAIVVNSGGFVLNGTLNGNNAASIFRPYAGAATTYNNATQPMATGILDTSTNLNTWIYGNLNQDIKGGPTTLSKQVYRNLTLNGGGTKTLQGYVSVLNTYTLTSPATLVNNGFTLTNP